MCWIGVTIREHWEAKGGRNWSRWCVTNCRGTCQDNHVDSPKLSWEFEYDGFRRRNNVDDQEGSEYSMADSNPYIIIYIGNTGKMVLIVLEKGERNGVVFNVSFL